MATPSVPYTFVNAATIDAAEHNANFAALVTFLSTYVIQNDGSLPFGAAQSMGGFKLTSLGTPTAATDAATKAYVDGLAAAEVVQDLVGAMFAGNTETLVTVTYQDADGTIDVELAYKDEDDMVSDSAVYVPTQQSVKAYVDTQDALRLALTGGTMSGAIAMGTSKITGMGDPTLDQDAATKKYVDDTVVAAVTEEIVEDYVGGMVTGNTETFIAVTYQDADGTLDFVVPVLDEDNMVSDSVAHLPTQQSVKAYVDGYLAISTPSLTLKGETGDPNIGATGAFVTIAAECAEYYDAQFHISFAGAGVAQGTGNFYYIAVPVTPKATYVDDMVIGTHHWYDTSGAERQAGVIVMHGTRTQIWFRFDQEANPARPTAPPFALAAGDSISGTFRIYK